MARFNEERPQPIFYMAGQFDGFETAKNDWKDGTMVTIARIKGVAGAPDTTHRIGIRPEWCPSNFNDADMETRHRINYENVFGRKTQPGLLTLLPGSAERAEKIFDALNELAEGGTMDGAHLTYALNAAFEEFVEDPLVFLYTTRQSSKAVKVEVDGEEKWERELTQYREFGWGTYIPTDAERAGKTLESFMKSAQKAEQKFDKGDSVHPVELKFDPNLLV